jgi:phosphate transport system protein
MEEMPGQKALDEFNQLRLAFLDLGTRIEDAVADAVRRIRDPRTPVPVEKQNGGDSPADQARRIVRRSQRIVLLYQPVASDFREVAAIPLMTIELKGLSALARELAERVGHLVAWPVPVPDELTQLAEEVRGMVHSALRAYARRDALAARRTIRTRTRVGALSGALTDWLTGTMQEHPAVVEPGLNLFALIQIFLRIAAHAIRFAEEAELLSETPNTQLTPKASSSEPRERSLTGSSRF